MRAQPGLKAKRRGKIEPLIPQHEKVSPKVGFQPPPPPPTHGPHPRESGSVGRSVDQLGKRER